MPSSYFSGTKINSGGAMFATFSSKDQSVFFRVIKQTAWDEKTQKPSFAGGASFNLKLSPDEVGEIIHAVSGHTSWKFYHSFGDDVTTGSFGYWEKEYKGKDGNPAKSSGFGLTAKKGEVLVKIGLSLGAAERLSQYLQFALNHMNSAIYSQDKKEAEEYMKKKENKTPAKPALVEENPTNSSDDAAPPEIVEDEENLIPF